MTITSMRLPRTSDAIPDQRRQRLVSRTIPGYQGGRAECNFCLCTRPFRRKRIPRRPFPFPNFSLRTWSDLVLSESGVAAVVVNDAFDALAFDEAEHPTGPHAPSVDPVPGRPAAIGVVEFSPPAYLEAFPEVADSIAAAAVHSALDHYMRVGQGERRLERLDYLRALAGGTTEQPAHGVMSFNIDTSMVSTSGTFFVVGWSDDRETALASVSIDPGYRGMEHAAAWRGAAAPMSRTCLQVASAGHRFGFWAVHRIPAVRCRRPSSCSAPGLPTVGSPQTELRPRIVSDVDLRETILGHFASLQYPGQQGHRGSTATRSRVPATSSIALNRSISRRITSAAHVERYGPDRTRFSASFIVCLFGKPEYFFLQNALFGSATRSPGGRVHLRLQQSGADGGILQKEALIAELIYGQSLTLGDVARQCRVQRGQQRGGQLRAQRPDRLHQSGRVPPRRCLGARMHADIVASRPRNETALFGAPLYYDDGSLDAWRHVFRRGSWPVRHRRPTSRCPACCAWSITAKARRGSRTAIPAPRPVPAVTGAFISAHHRLVRLHSAGSPRTISTATTKTPTSASRACSATCQCGFRTFASGTLEGKGSVRRPPHEGGSLVNRWLFTRTWGKVIEVGPGGPFTPRHRLLKQGPAAAPEPTSRTSIRCRPRRKALKRHGACGRVFRPAGRVVKLSR